MLLLNGHQGWVFGIKLANAQNEVKNIHDNGFSIIIYFDILKWIINFQFIIWVKSLYFKIDLVSHYHSITENKGEQMNETTFLLPMIFL